MAKKKLILVTSPPACGKTFVTKNLARALNNCVYLDKDDLIILSKQIYKVAGEPFDRSSDFFHDNIRDAEYLAILEVAFSAITYNDTVLKTAEARAKHIARCLKNYNDDELEQLFTSLHPERQKLITPTEPTFSQLQEPNHSFCTSIS